MAKNQHVVPYDGGWAVRGEGNQRATSTHGTQAEAIDAAREIASNQRSEVVIHRPDGRIRDRDSYGSDPLPPKTPRKVLFPSPSEVTNPDKIKIAVSEVLNKTRDNGGRKGDSFPPRDRKH